mgnify:CR=1 FL=1
MKTQTSKSQIYCPMAAIRYARVLYEVGVPKEAVQKTREIFEEVPQLHEIFANPTIELQKKMNVVDRVFPKEIRNFLKVACRYQRMNLIEDIFTAYDRYCDEQNQVLRRAYFHHGILCGAILLGEKQVSIGGTRLAIRCYENPFQSGFFLGGCRLKGRGTGS